MAEIALTKRQKMRDSACRSRRAPESDCSIRNRSSQEPVRPRTSTRKTRLNACEHCGDAHAVLCVLPLVRKERRRKTEYTQLTRRPELDIEGTSYADVTAYPCASCYKDHRVLSIRNKGTETPSFGDDIHWVRELRTNVLTNIYSCNENRK